MLKILRKPQFRFGLLVLGFITAWYVVMSFRPIVMSLRMAVTDYQILDPGNSPWVGAENFKTLLFDYTLFRTAAKNTAVYALMVTLATIPLSLAIAAALAHVGRGRGFYQGAIFLPVVVSMAAIALLFRHLMDPGGVLNHLLVSVGLPKWSWLVGARSVMPSIAAIATWKGLGGNVVIMLAGLLSIPEELYDAAKVDGAGALRQFQHVTLPLLGPTLKLVLILVTIGSLQAYQGVMILTNGGPANHTFLINQFVVEEAFSNFRFGMASAGAFILLVVSLVIVVFQLRIMKSDWEY